MIEEGYACSKETMPSTWARLETKESKIMFQRILVPLDGSALAEQALPTAAHLARSAGGSVILLRVASPPVEYASGATYMIYTPLDTMERLKEAEEAEARRYLKVWPLLVPWKACRHNLRCTRAW